MTTSSVRRARRSTRRRVAQKADAHRAQLLVDVRVVDDFAGQIHAAIGEALPRLVGVVDGAIDAVAEAEFAREMDGQPPGSNVKSLALICSTSCAVVVLGEHAGDGILHVETFAEDE